MSRASRIARGVALLALAAGAQAAEPLVLAQSLPLTGAGFTVSNRIVAGASAAVDAFNRAGGVGGRTVRLVSVDDAGDAVRHAANLRRLVDEEHPVAFVNCLGEASCAAAAAVVRATQVALVGPMSGAPALRALADAPVHCIRADAALEAVALAGQLKSLGVGEVAILGERRGAARTPEILAEALRRKGLPSFIVRADAADMRAALQRVREASALVVDLGLDGAEALGQLPPSAFDDGPKVVASLATPGLATLMKLFPGRVLGFTAVVPQPELPNSALVRNLQRDAEALGPEAVTYEGLEAYVDTLVALEAIRRAGPQANARGVALEMARLGRLDLGGFALAFGRAGRGASEWVDIGLRARNGVLLR